MNLAGKRVVVTRARDQAASLGALLEEAGAQVIYLPTIEIKDPPSWDPLDSSLERLRRGEYEWVLFASANAA